MNPEGEKNRRVKRTAFIVGDLSGESHVVQNVRSPVTQGLDVQRVAVPCALPFGARSHLQAALHARRVHRLTEGDLHWPSGKVLCAIRRKYPDHAGMGSVSS